MVKPLVSDADLERLVRLAPDRHGLAGEIYELPLVPDFAVSFTNAHPRALYRCDVDGDVVTPTALVGWAFHLPWETNPIPANKASGKSHWARVYRATWPVRQIGQTLATAARIGRQPRIRVRLDWEVVDNRRRDEDNLVPCMKALVDGITAAGVIPDDHRVYCLRDMPEIHFAPKSPKRPSAYMRLWIFREPALAPEPVPA